MARAQKILTPQEKKEQQAKASKRISSRLTRKEIEKVRDSELCWGSTVYLAQTIADMLDLSEADVQARINQLQITESTMFNNVGRPGRRRALH